jgi:hypothetical protein
MTGSAIDCPQPEPEPELEPEPASEPPREQPTSAAVEASQSRTSRQAQLSAAAAASVQEPEQATLGQGDDSSDTGRPAGSACGEEDEDTESVDPGAPTAAEVARAEAEDEEEEEAAEAAEAAGGTVSLGFAELPEAQYLLESVDFPSKIGGLPAWLHPAGVPVNKNRCPHCGMPLTFLLQLYAEATASNGFPREDAFHRSLFLFTCRDSSCHSKPPPALPPFRVWRSQLPRHSPFYSATPPDYSRAPAPGTSLAGEGAGARCTLCGGPATKRCSGCQAVAYCSAEHQREDWKLVHKYVCISSRSRQLTPPLGVDKIEKKQRQWRLKEYEIAIEDEPAAKDMSTSEKARLAKCHLALPSCLTALERLSVAYEIYSGGPLHSCCLALA